MQHTAHARAFFYGLLGLVLIGGFFFLRPYLAVLLFAVLLAILFHPLYEWLERALGGRQWLAVPLALISVLLAFIVPLAAASSLVVQVVTEFVHAASKLTFNGSYTIANVVANINEVFALIPFANLSITAEQVVGWLQSLAALVQSSAWNGLRGLGGTLVLIAPTFFIMVYVMGAVFTRYHRISVYLHKLSPLDDAIDRLYARRILSMTTSMVRGTFVIAAIQGALTGLFLWAGGVPYAAFFGLLAALLSVIPLGAGIIALPAGLLLILSGNIWQGVLQIAGYLLLVSNVDNLLRPRLVSKDASLHPALVLLGIFGGLYHFGFLGLIYGPVFMIVLVTSIEVYREHFAGRS